MRFKNSIFGGELRINMKLFADGICTFKEIMRKLYNLIPSKGHVRNILTLYTCSIKDF